MAHGDQDKRIIRMDLGLPGQPGTSIMGLKMSASIEKTDTSTLDKGKFQVWGLSDDKMAIAKDPKAIVRFFAGYQSNPPQLFLGDIDEDSAKTSRESDGMPVLEFKAKDGLRRYRNSKLFKAYENNITSDELLKILAKQMALEFATLPTDLGTTVFENGFVVAGPVRNSLTKILKPLDATWTIQDGEIIVTKRGGARQVDAVLVSPSTGLKGYPQRTDKGIKAVAQLNASIKPRHLVVLESSVAQGTFLVKKANYKVANYGDEFDVEFEGPEIK